MSLKHQGRDIQKGVWGDRSGGWIPTNRLRFGCYEHIKTKAG